MSIESFAGKGPAAALSGPSPVYLSGEEQLRFQSVGNTTGLIVQVTGRVLRPDNTISPISFAHVPNSTRTTASTVVALSEGWLLGIEARVLSGTVPGNGLWGILDLVRGSGTNIIPLQALAWDFISAVDPLMWGGALNVGPLDGAGCLRAIVGSAPGAGNQISETVPTGARWEPICFSAILTTSGAAANRIVALTLDDGTNIYHVESNNINQAASTLLAYEHAQGNQRIAAPLATGIPCVLPTGLKMGAGHRIRTSTVLMQAGDTFNAPNYLVREWFDV